MSVWNLGPTKNLNSMWSQMAGMLTARAHMAALWRTSQNHTGSSMYLTVFLKMLNKVSAGNSGHSTYLHNG